MTYADECYKKLTLNDLEGLIVHGDSICVRYIALEALRRLREIEVASREPRSEPEPQYIDRSNPWI